MSAPLVVVRDVVKDYSRGGRSQGALAVDGVSLDIHAGETFGLVGESGSGKSTLARVIMRIEPPTAGQVLLDGVDVWRARGRALRALRHRQQIVFQNPATSLNRRHDVARIVGAPLEVAGVAAGERRRRVAELLDQVGLASAHAGRRPGELSGGQCQRVAIARALALGPRLVVLDEAVSALDVSIRAQILNLLRDIQEREGVAYLFVSHDLSIVRYMAPRLAVMERGRIVEAGARDAVLARPRHPYTRALLAAIPDPDPRRPFPRRDAAFDHHDDSEADTA
jgi:peptide/nickel transport system ATP-binding protein